MLKRACLGIAIALAALGSAQANLICQLRPGANPYHVAQQYAIQFREQAPGGVFFLFFVPAGLDPHTIQAQMATDANVVWAEDDGQLVLPENVGGGKGSSVAVVNDRGKAYAQNALVFQQVGFNPSFTQATGRSMRVAVLDTGIAPDCGILWAKTVAQYNAVEKGLNAYDVKRNTDTNGNGLKDEGFGHGTFVAGIVDQISPRSKLVIARVADSDGVATAWTLIKGIAFAAISGAEVVNVSLGTQDRIPALTDVLDWAELRGMVIVAAAGNGNLDTLDNPSDISKVLAITGVDGIDKKAPFANYNGKTEHCAPATGIRSYGPYGRMMIWSGTSFAAPFVTASVAECLRHLSAKLTPAGIRLKVEESGTNIDPQNPAFGGQLGHRLWIPDLWTKLRTLAGV